MSIYFREFCVCERFARLCNRPIVITRFQYTKSGGSGAQVKLLTAKLSIGIFTLLKLCLADAIRNFKVGENGSAMAKWRSTIQKFCRLMSRFNLFKSWYVIISSKKSFKKTNIIVSKELNAHRSHTRVLEFNPCSSIQISKKQTVSFSSTRTDFVLLGAYVTKR